MLRLITRMEGPEWATTENPFARQAPVRQEGYPPAKRRDQEWTQEKGGAFRAPPVFKCVFDSLARRLAGRIPALAERAQAERPFAAPARIVLTVDLLAGAGKLFHRVVALADGGGKLLAKTFRRLPEVVAAQSCSLGERGIGKMSPVANAGAIFLELDLTLEIGCHLVEFANDSLEVLDLPRFLLDLTAFEKNGRLT